MQQEVDEKKDSTVPQAPSSFYCPISMELMAEPVMVATGHTYDRTCIERWIAQGNKSCPVTGMRLRHLELTPNYALRGAIQVRLYATMSLYTCRYLRLSSRVAGVGGDASDITDQRQGGNAASATAVTSARRASSGVAKHLAGTVFLLQRWM